MARFEFKQDPPPPDWNERSNALFSLTVRGLGLVLLLVGMFVALRVVVSAWSLYANPAGIENFAAAIERGSNLDLALEEVTAPATAANLEPQSARPGRTGSAPAFRLSYFVAWLIAILLLLLIGRLAIAAVRTGGELALYDVQLKKLVRALVAEQLRAGNSRSNAG